MMLEMISNVKNDVILWGLWTATIESFVKTSLSPYSQDCELFPLLPQWPHPYNVLGVTLQRPRALLDDPSKVANFFLPFSRLSALIYLIQWLSSVSLSPPSRISPPPPSTSVQVSSTSVHLVLVSLRHQDGPQSARNGNSCSVFIPRNKHDTLKTHNIQRQYNEYIGEFVHI